MNGFSFTLAGASLIALPSGALWWPDQSLLCVSDLHLGKSDRLLRAGAPHLPPYETRDTLFRLEQDIHACSPKTMVCLGDSFDDQQAEHGLDENERSWILRLQAGRRWVWIEGNHDPGPLDLGGTHLGLLPIPPLTFRHIAEPKASGDISGHYHPKARLTLKGRRLSKPCFLLDSDRVILPAYGTYTGGLDTSSEVLTELMRKEAIAILTGTRIYTVPMPR